MYVLYTVCEKHNVLYILVFTRNYLCEKHNLLVGTRKLFNMGTMNCPDCPICYKHLLEISTRPPLLRPQLGPDSWPIRS